MGSGNSTHMIHRAARSGDLVVVRRYLNKPAILNRRDVEGMTCLHWAAQLGQINVVQELLAVEAIELDEQDVNGWTPLMHACCRGHKPVVGALISAGANLEIESHDGRTALHRAATWNRLGPLDQLIEAGANVHHEAHNKWTPLHCASAAGDVHACAILVEGGADVSAKDIFGLKPVDVVADLATTELVMRALTPGRLASAAATPTRFSRSASIKPAATPSPHTSPPTRRSEPEVFPSAFCASGANMARGGGGEQTSSLSSPLLPKSESFPTCPVGSARSGVGKRGGKSEIPLMVKAKTVCTAGVDGTRRGSWTRPVGPWPRPSGRGSGSGSVGGEIENEGGCQCDVRDNGMCNPISVELGGEPPTRSTQQAASVTAESIGESGAGQPLEVVENGRDADVLLERRNLLPKGGSRTDGGISVKAGKSAPLRSGGGDDDEESEESRRYLGKSQNTGKRTIDNRENEV